MKKIILFILFLAVNLSAQNYIIRQDSLRASESRLKDAIRDSLNANTRGWINSQQAGGIIRDSLDVNSRGFTNTIQVKQIINDSLSINARNWQTAGQVKAIVNDSLTANSRGWINSIQARQIVGDSLNANSRNWQSKTQVENIVKDTSTVLNAKIATKAEASTVTQLSGNLNTIYQALLDSIANLRPQIGGVQPTNPSPVTNLVATAGNGVVTLNWTNPTVKDSVQIERYNSSAPGLGFIVLGYTTSNSYTDNTVINGNTYTYRLRVFYQGFASTSVTVNATPQEPPRNFYFAISPSSINFNNLGDGREEGVVADAETGDLTGIILENNNGANGTIQALPEAKIHGNYGYKLTSSGNPSANQTQLSIKKLFSTTGQDSMCVRFTLKIPADYPYSDTSTTINNILILKRASNGTQMRAALVARFGSTVRQLYGVQYYRNGEVFQYPVFSPAYNLDTNVVYTIEFRLVSGSSGSVTVLVNNQVIYTVNDNISTSMLPGYASVGITENGGYTRAGEHLYIDDIKISRQPIGLFNAPSSQAIVTVRNDSSYTFGFQASVASPFSIDGQPVYNASLSAGNSIQLKLQVDTVGLAPGTYNKYLTILNQYNSQQVLLTYTQPGDTTPVQGEGSKGWFVNKNATGLNNGTSWNNAWTSFSSINWNNVQPGDTIYISRGADSLIYTETFPYPPSGKHQITITKGKSAGHNGRVVIKAPTDKSGNAVYKNSGTTNNGMAFVGLEFHNWRYGFYIRGTYDSLKIANCRFMNSGEAAVDTWGGDTLGNQKNFWFINNYVQTHPEGRPTAGQTDGVSIYYVMNSFVIGNTIINANQKTQDTHNDFLQGEFNTNVYVFNNFFVHTNLTTAGQNGFGAAGKGDFYVANNIVVEGNYTNNSPIWVGYDSHPFYQSMKIRIVNNTLICGHHMMVLIGFRDAVIKNNILYATGTYSGSMFGRSYFISATYSSTWDVPVSQWVIKSNSFYAWYSPTTIKYLSPGSDGNPPTMDASNGFYYPMYSSPYYKPSFVNFPNFTSSVITYTPSTFPYSLNPQDYRLTSSSTREIGTAEVLQESDYPTNSLAPSWFKAWNYIKKDFNGVDRGNSSWDRGAFKYVP